MNKIIVIDGNSLLFRAYYATSYGDKSSIMRTKSGVPTNAIFAFANMLSKILSSFKSDEGIFIGFDSDKETFRKEEFKDYKANRAPCPEDLKPQFPLSRELCDALGIIYYEEHGIEADDICGSVAKKASEEGHEVIIYTSDHDYLQLIDRNIKVSLLKVGLSNMEEYDEAHLKEKMGLTPSQIIDYKGLRGDSSDNYPGIPGIGEKGALKLLQEYGTFDKVIKNAEKGNIKGKIGEKIVAGKELGYASFRLARIKTDVTLPFKIEDLTYRGYSFSSVNLFAQKYEMKQLLSRLPISLKKADPSSMKVESVNSFQNIDIPSYIGLSLDIDFSSYHEKKMLGIAIATDKNTYYETVEDLLKDKKLIAALSDPSIKKAVYDGKATIYALSTLGIEIKGIEDDILLASYLLDSALSITPELVYGSFGVDIDEKKEETISLLTLDDSNPEKCGKMAFYALYLLPKINNSLKSINAFSLYKDLEMPLMAVLAKMELEGFPLHQDKLEEYGKLYNEKKKAAEEEVFALAGERFNLNSPKQIAHILYEKLSLPHEKNAGTSVEDLSAIYDKSPIVPKILEYRKYAKLLNTYVDGLIPHIKEDKKIHSYFNQAQTTTGRLSSSSPNLQNISARDEEGKQIRNAFYYDDPSIKLMSLDYGQIELRLLAALSGCKRYIDVFNNGHDVHTETARRIFGHQEVSDGERRKAKAVNFAIIYGTSDYGLSQQIGTYPREAKRIIESFYNSYPEVKEYLNKITHEATTNGYVTTMLGRRRYLRDINDPNFVRREAARRAALNAPIQGSAADLIKIAMLKIDKYLSEHNLKTKMVLQIHDELIFAVPEEELETVKKDIKEIMENAVSLPVKLTAEVGVGSSWYEAK